MNNYFGIEFPPRPIAYGSFSSTQSQNITQGEALPFTYDTQDITPVKISQSGENIFVEKGGMYKVMTSLQCNKTTGGNGDLEMWIAINGTAVPNSATRTQINQNQEVVMSVEWFVELSSGDAVSIVGYSRTTGLQALAIPEDPPIPAIPSIITTIMRIGL